MQYWGNSLKFFSIIYVTIGVLHHVLRYAAKYVNYAQKAVIKSTSGLYYKHITIVIDAASVISKWYSKL